MESPSAPATELTRKDWLMPLWLVTCSSVLLVVIYLQFIWPASWAGSAEPLSWKGSALNLTKGQGYSRDGALIIESLADQGIAVASLSPKSFRAKDYLSVQWNIADVQPGAQLFFLWRTVDNPSRVFTRPLAPTGNGTFSLDLVGDPDWLGQIMGLAISVKGQLDAPILLRNFSLSPASAGVAMSSVTGKWFAPENWQGTSINFLDGTSLEQRVPYVLATAGLVLLALALYFLLATFKFVRVHAIILLSIVFFGWLMLDARWQLNLLRQLHSTQSQFAGKSAEEKYRAADKDLFEFMQQVKAKLAAADVRVLYFADDDYLRGKGAYYLYPHNVMARNDVSAIPQLKPGEYIVLYKKKGVQYDTGRRSLSVAGTQPIAAELLVSDAGNLLVRVQ